MISLTAVALAAALSADGAPCPAEAAGGFRLAVDWDRAADIRTESGRLFPASNRPAPLDCALASAAVSPDRSRIPPQRTLPESSSPNVSEAAVTFPPPFSFFVKAGGVYDSNIDQSDKPIRDWGTVYGVGTRFETDAFQVEYEVASHSYVNTDRWDRVSHDLTSSYEQKFSKKLSIETVGEIALKGSSEDRELGDQYILQPRIHYRISPSSRLRLYGAYRLRRYEENPDRDALNRYVGLELRQRLARATVEFGYRWENNQADNPRFTYDRQTYSAQFSTPLYGGLHRLAAEVRYRPQQYQHRFIDHANTTLRRDARWIFSLDAAFALGRHLELVSGYTYENRSSNDPDKKYNAHIAGVGLRYWFGRGGNPRIVSRQPTEPPADPGKREVRAKADSESLPPDRLQAPGGKLAAKSSDAPVSASNAARIPDDRWVHRAEEDRRRFVRGEFGPYSLELDLVCGDRSLQEAWSHDSRSGAMWLLRSSGSCYRVFWGHFSSERDATRALRSLPAYFRSGSRPPSVVQLAPAGAAAEGNPSSR
ncbi:MAG: hypothetical protein ABJC28_06360 [Acidobacteriota bacterium]